MASMFPQNLDDGERWLPAEIIPDVLGTHRSHRVLGAAVDRLSLEELAWQLAALGLFNPARPAFRNPQPDIQGFRRASNAVGSSYVNGFRVPPVASIGGTGAFLPVSRSQVREEEDGRARVLRRIGPVRFMLGRGNGTGKDSGGTGVFLPRAVYNDIEKKPKETSGYDGELQVEKQKQLLLQQAIRRYDAAAEAQQKQQLVMASSIQATAAELTLPQEWTY